MPAERTTPTLNPRTGGLLSDRWGEEALGAGWVGVPVALLEGQRELELDAIDLAIIVHLLRFWWQRSKLPHPSKARLARALGLEPRTIQRHLADLEKARLVVRRKRTDGAGRNLTSEFDLSGLVARVEQIAARVVDGRKAMSRDDGKAE